LYHQKEGRRIKERQLELGLVFVLGLIEGEMMDCCVESTFVSPSPLPILMIEFLLSLDDPSAKKVVDVSKTLASEVGNGTTSAAVLCAELLREA
jgi:hypothetical protein